jgi:hypothetical protein
MNDHVSEQSAERPALLSVGPSCAQTVSGQAITDHTTI